MNDTYYTIEKPSEGIFKDRGSKFFAFAFPVTTEEEISEIQKRLRKKYYDARHHCYAFRLKPEGNIWRASDDGEPANSSGPPIFGQIRSHNLTNILIVVVRYFGGTKLGIPGLVNAYKTASENAIHDATIIEKTVNDIVELSFEYPLMNDVMRVIKEENIEQIKQSFELNCMILIRIRKKESEKVIKRFEKIRGLSLAITGEE